MINCRSLCRSKLTPQLLIAVLHQFHRAQSLILPASLSSASAALPSHAAPSPVIISSVCSAAKPRPVLPCRCHHDAAHHCKSRPELLCPARRAQLCPALIQSSTAASLSCATAPSPAMASHCCRTHCLAAKPRFDLPSAVPSSSHGLSPSAAKKRKG